MAVQKTPERVLYQMRVLFSTISHRLLGEINW